MKKLFIAAVLLALVVSSAAAQKKTEPKTKKDKISYSIGVNIGKDFKMRGMDINPDMLARGMKDGMSGGTTALSDSAMEAVMMAYQKEMMQKMDAQKKVIGDKNKKEGAAFLAANKLKDGVVTLPDGLQYKILTAGTGPKPTADQTVTCHYRGTLIDGTEFDSSYKRGQPAEFPLKGVIKGWTEALQLMPTGSKWQLFIPSDLAYGENGAGQSIGPNATLVFEVELISIK